MDKLNNVILIGFYENENAKKFTKLNDSDSIKYFRNRQVNINIIVSNILPSRGLFSTYHVGNNMRTKLKLKRRIAVDDTSSHRYGKSHVNGITQCYLPPERGNHSRHNPS